MEARSFLIGVEVHSILIVSEDSPIVIELNTQVAVDSWGFLLDVLHLQALSSHIHIGEHTPRRHKHHPLLKLLQAYNRRLIRFTVVLVHFLGLDVINRDEFVVVEVIDVVVVAGGADYLAGVADRHLRDLGEVFEGDYAVGDGQLFLKDCVFAVLALGVRVVVLQHGEEVAIDLWEVVESLGLKHRIGIPLLNLLQTINL